MNSLFFRHIAAAPPVIISSRAPLKEAQRLFSLSGAEALVVEEGGKFRGLLERCVLEKALFFGLGERAEDLLDPEPPTLEAGKEVSPEALARALFTPSSCAVILEGGKVAGTLSAKEVFVFMGAGQIKGFAYPRGDVSRAFLTLGLMETGPLACPSDAWCHTLNARIRSILLAAREEAESLGVNVFLVGGGVRDLLLGKPVFDLDLVVSQKAEDLARGLARRLSGELKARSLFGTYKVRLSEGQEIDVAQSRWEYYEAPAALPRVAPGPLREDLFRRDFTINAMALALNGPLAGMVIDPFGGRKDLSARRLRIHHILSLVDDPTRIFRAARYLVRFGLKPGPAFFVSLSLVRRYKVLKNLSPARIRKEGERILEEPAPPEVFSRLFAFGVFDDICGAETISVREEIQELWSLARGLNLQKKDLLCALALLFQKVSPDWHRLFDFSPGQAERLEKDLKLLERKASVLLSGGRRSRKVAILEKVSSPAILVFALRFPLVKEFVREYFLRLKDLRPTISGQDLLAAGLSPGPQVGQILKRLREAWLDGEVSSPKEERTWLRKEFPHVFS